MNQAVSLPSSPARLPNWLQTLVTYKLALLLALCVVVRVGALLALPGIFDFVSTGAIHGSATFDTYASNLVATGVYGVTPGVPDAVLPPFYSLTLALVYGVFGRGYWQVGLYHTLLDVASIAMLYLIGKRLFTDRLGDWVSWLAGVFYALYPYLVFQNLTVIDTPLFIAQLHGFLLVMILLRDRERRDRVALLLALIGGVILGTATLTRPILVPLALLVTLWFLFRRSLVDSFLRLLPVAVVSLLVLIPWILRNQAVYNTFVPISITGGSNLYQGNNPDVIPLLKAGYDVQWTGEDEFSGLTPAADAARSQQALDWLRANRNLIPELVWVKFLTHWSIDIFPRVNPTAGEEIRPDYQGDAVQDTDDTGAPTLGDLNPGDAVTLYDAGEFDAARIVHRWYFGILLALALVGVALTFRRWREVSLLWLVQVNMTVMYIIFHPSTRYRVPSDPLLFLFSAYTLILLWQRVRQLI
jgi:4-amino-4-deoxy-L-arabinose transferase-like glycosyltransferase